MLVTRVSIDKYLGTSNGKGVVAEVSVTIDRLLVIHGILVCNGVKGRFVAMPSRDCVASDTGKRKYIDIVHPIEPKLKELLDREVLYELSVYESKL